LVSGKLPLTNFWGKTMKKRLALTAIVAIMPMVSAVYAQDGNLYGVDTNNDAEAAAVSGGNNFDFSNSRSNPPAPGMPSFAGGPCMGEGVAGSTSIAGVAVGAGRSTLDDSCQRRNWVQTLIGASQHMTEDEKRVMMRVAVEVMREDPYLAGPLERAGLGTANAEAFKQAEKDRAELEALREKNAELEDAAKESGSEIRMSTKSVKFATTCIVSANAAPEAVVEMLAAKNCKVLPNGDKN
jgi:hypothetical protein